MFLFLRCWVLALDAFIPEQVPWCSPSHTGGFCHVLPAIYSGYRLLGWLPTGARPMSGTPNV